MIQLDDITVLIPAAGRVPEGLLALSNIGCPAMIPVAGRPVIYWTVAYLRELGLKRYIIGIPQRGTFIEDFVETSFGHDCEFDFVVPSADRGVGGTVHALAARAHTTSVLVVLGDTHFQFEDPTRLGEDTPFVLVRSVDESYRWCIAESSEDGTILALHDKQSDVFSSPLQALIGVYYFPRTEELCNYARQAVDESTVAGRRTEMSDILNRLRQKRTVLAVEASDWLDCGNPDRQAASHRALLQKRAFNELSVDPILGTITKHSKNAPKFLDEIAYLESLPADLSVLFPRVLDTSKDIQEPWMRMEYYGYPSLSTVFIFENLDPGIWRRIFIHLDQLITQSFMVYKADIVASDIEEMYLTKTLERITSIKGPPELLSLIQSSRPITINGVRCGNLPELLPRITKIVDLLKESVQGCVIHGDLCLSNILYDPRSGICKFVDPRGSFGRSGIHGDPRYDVAKLYHSVYGLYDFLVNDLFTVDLSANRATLNIRARGQQHQICSHFESIFMDRSARSEILFITGLLFVSMTALHYDAPRRQIAMYLRGLQLLNEFFETYGETF